MTQHGDRSGVKAQGIGARVQRKEDARHLHGKGNFVADMSMPGLCEVAFARSPLAHARITAIEIPASLDGSVFTREHMDARDIVADSTLPTYQASAQPPLAHGKVRFVGEPVVMAVAPTRALAEDMLESISVDYEDLPVFSGIESALAPAGPLVHEHWKDNTFLTLTIDKGFDALAAKADVVVTRTIDLARHCMVPMEGKAVLAYWDYQADQLVVISATQVPHLIRTALADLLDLPQDQVRVIAPDVGGAFGYKCVLQQEELCVAWLAKTLRKPFRYIEDRREHLIAANTDADERDWDAELVGDPLDVVARGLRQLVPLGRVGDVGVPARTLLPHRLGMVEVGLVRRELLRDRAVGRSFCCHAFSCGCGSCGAPACNARDGFGSCAYRFANSWSGSDKTCRGKPYKKPN